MKYSKKMSLIKKIYFKLPVLIFDATSVIVAWLSAVYLSNPSAQLNRILLPLFGVLIIQIGSFYYFKIYRGVWRFFSFNDAVRIVKSVSVGTIGIFTLQYSSLIEQTNILTSMVLSSMVLYCLICTALLCAGRSILRHRVELDGVGNDILDKVQRVLIIGAGQAGESLIRELHRTKAFEPVGLIDDQFKKLGLELHGVRVLGGVEDLPVAIAKTRADLILIAIPSAHSADMRRIVEQCELCEIPFRTLPGLHALASGKVAIQALRKVNIEDLLGRDQVLLDWDKIRQYIADKRVLITGGGGSIGSELCQLVMSLSPKAMMVVESSEYNLYQIESEMQKKYPKIRFEKMLLSVADEIGVNYAFQQFKPQIVFHAAAYKHVPMLQDQIRIAVKNNILGTQIVAQASVAVGVEKFVLISTDKAVNPTNIMGATKRSAEIFCQNLNTRVNTQFIVVRFGNVLGSVGSVVPLFQKQLEQGGPLTVTHPDIQRYFMTIREACELILQAMANGQGGEIFVLDMGEPVKITYLAEQMINLAGKVLGKDIDIKYTGLRPGEKLFEELFLPSEQLVKTEHPKLLKAKFCSYQWDELIETFQLMQQACKQPSQQQDEELFVLLKSLVPELNYQIHTQDIYVS